LIVAEDLPAHEGLGPDDRNGLEDRRKPTIQLDEEQTIAVGELDAARTLPCSTVS
jgi:hypothetical protein